MNESSTTIVQARPEHTDAVADLFDLYRQFYDEPSDLENCRDYIRERIARSESVIFVAFDRGQNEALGFTQLYPTFCSVALARIFVLYDLYTRESARRSGIGGKLMDRAGVYASGMGADRLELQTHHTNLRAQSLYESLGYKKDEEFFSYALTL